MTGNKLEGHCQWIDEGRSPDERRLRIKSRIRIEDKAGITDPVLSLAASDVSSEHPARLNSFDLKWASKRNSRLQTPLHSLVKD